MEEQTTQNKECNHCWKSRGLWDGWDGTGKRRINTGGPVVVCEKCNEEKNITWDEWKQIPEINKSKSDSTTPETI